MQSHMNVRVASCAPHARGGSARRADQPWVALTCPRDAAINDPPAAAAAAVTDNDAISSAPGGSPRTLGL